MCSQVLRLPNAEGMKGLSLLRASDSCSVCMIACHGRHCPGMDAKKGMYGMQSCKLQSGHESSGDNRQLFGVCQIAFDWD